MAHRGRNRGRPPSTADSTSKRDSLPTAQKKRRTTAQSPGSGKKYTNDKSFGGYRWGATRLGKQTSARRTKAGEKLGQGGGIGNLGDCGDRGRAWVASRIAPANGGCDRPGLAKVALAKIAVTAVAAAPPLLLISSRCKSWKKYKSSCAPPKNQLDKRARYLYLSSLFSSSSSSPTELFAPQKCSDAPVLRCYSRTKAQKANRAISETTLETCRTPPEIYLLLRVHKYSCTSPKSSWTSSRTSAFFPRKKARKSVRRQLNRGDRTVQLVLGEIYNYSINLRDRTHEKSVANFPSR